MKCAYEDKECSSACIHAKTCAKWKLKNGKAPCLECQKRTETCHISCEDYKRWVRNKLKRNSKVRKQRERERASDERQRDAVRRMMKHRNR